MSMPHVDTVLVPRIPRVPVITSLSFSFSALVQWKASSVEVYPPCATAPARALPCALPIRTKDGSDRTGRVRRGADRRRAAAVWESKHLRRSKLRTTVQSGLFVA